MSILGRDVGITAGQVRPLENERLNALHPEKNKASESQPHSHSLAAISPVFATFRAYDYMLTPH